MVLRRWGVLAFVVVVNVGLVGCSGDDGDDQPGAVRSSTVQATAESSPDESVLPAVEQVPLVPAAMASGDVAGAEAFVRHYFALVNYAQRTGELDPLRAVSGAECVACRGGLDSLAQLGKRGESLIGGEYAVKEIREVRAIKNSFVVETVVANTAQRVVDRSGETIRSHDAARTELVLTVSAPKTPGAPWRVDDWDFA